MLTLFRSTISWLNSSLQVIFMERARNKAISNRFCLLCLRALMQPIFYMYFMLGRVHENRFVFLARDKKTCALRSRIDANILSFIQLFQQFFHFSSAQSYKFKGRSFLLKYCVRVFLAINNSTKSEARIVIPTCLGDRINKNNLQYLTEWKFEQTNGFYWICWLRGWYRLRFMEIFCRLAIYGRFDCVLASCITPHSSKILREVSKLLVRTLQFGWNR